MVLTIPYFLIPVNIRADTIGQRESFFVNNKYDKYGRTNLNAALRYVGDKLYVYVEDDYWNSLGSVKQDLLSSNILAMGIEFDNNIYPKETAFFGSEPNPGVDNDSRITILLENLVINNGGYFDSANAYTRDKIDNSNQREMIVVSIDTVLAGTDFTKVFLAHEFQHLISFNQKELIGKISEDVWLNELRSEYTASLLGYDAPYTDSSLKRRMDYFLQQPSDSLVEWPNTNADYAVVNVFGQYLTEQFGQGILKDTMKSGLTGISSINKYLIDLGYSGRFEDIFGYWMGALYLNDYIFDKHLGFYNPNFTNIKVQPQQRIYISGNQPQFSSIQNIKPWQPVWLEYDLGGISGNSTKSLKISLDSETGKIFRAFYMVFYNDNTVNIGKASLIDGKGDVVALNSAKGLRKIVLMLTEGTKISRFDTDELSSYININATVAETETVKAQMLKDGMLIKRPREKEIYVIWGKYKRYLSSGVISLYGHLNPAEAVEVEPDVFDSYQSSNYVKYLNDEKVYAVWPDGTKHWLNITPRQWDDSYRDWNAIFTINDMELNYYRIGENIIR